VVLRNLIVRWGLVGGSESTATLCSNRGRLSPGGQGGILPVKVQPRENPDERGLLGLKREMLQPNEGGRRKRKGKAAIRSRGGGQILPGRRPISKN